MISDHSVQRKKLHHKHLQAGFLASSLQSIHDLLRADGFGWSKVENTWQPVSCVWKTLPEASKDCRMLLKCGWKSQHLCSRNRCRKAGPPCTTLAIVRRARFDINNYFHLYSGHRKKKGFPRYPIMILVCWTLNSTFHTKAGYTCDLHPTSQPNGCVSDNYELFLRSLLPRHVVAT